MKHLFRCFFFTFLQAFAMQTILRLLCPIAFLVFAATAYAYGDPHESYLELESDHFVVHYPASRHAFAWRAVAIAEEAHGVLAPVFGSVTKEKTHISVENHLDIANGWARVVYANEIHLYPYPPFASGELGNYTDWMRQLIYHEYTHILHMDTSDNVLYDVLNAIFGKFARSNATMPRWFTEGLAVYFETRTSSGGRLRAESYRTFMRNAALDGRIPTLGGLSAQPVAWPAGSSDYIFGAFFVQWLVKVYGEEKVIEYIHAYSRQMIPYALNRVARHVFGKTMDALYEAWRVEETRKAGMERIAFEKTVRATPAKTMIAPHRHAHPNARPGDHAFSYYRDDGAHRTGIFLYDMETDTSSFLAECWMTCDSRWSKDGHKLYFDHIEMKDGYRRLNSLYTFDMATRKIERLTRDVHIRTYDVSATHLYVVSQTDESVSLMRVPLSSVHADMTQDEFETLYRSRAFEELEELRVYSGSTPEEDRLAMTYFSQEARDLNYKNGRFVSEEHADLAHHVMTTYVKAIDRDGNWLADGLDYTPIPSREPEWIDREDGLFLAYSAVADDGTLTRYIEDAEGNTRLVARRLEGIHAPTMLASGDYVFIQYTSHGMAVAKIEKDALFSIAQPEAPRRARWKHEVVDLPLVVPDMAQRDYLPWRWMFPLTWMPSFVGVGKDITLGLSWSGRDYLDHHQYAMSAAYNFGMDVLNFSASYVYARLLWNLAFSAGIQNSSALWFDGNRYKTYDYQQSSASLTAYRTWGGRLLMHQLALGMRVSHTQSSDRFSYPLHDPAAPPPRIPALGWQNALLISYTLSHRRQYEKAVAVSDGQLLRASLRLEAPWIGADAYALIASLDAQFSWTLPWFETHAIGLALSAGTSYVQNASRTPFALSTTVNTTFSLEDLMQLSSQDALIHGYRPGSLAGQHYLYAHLDYHFGIYDPVLGTSTLPLGLQRISATLYGDWGYAWYPGVFHILDSKPAVGASLHFDITLGYRLIQRFTLGYAYGEMHQFYFGFF